MKIGRSGGRAAYRKAMMAKKAARTGNLNLAPIKGTDLVNDIRNKRIDFGGEWRDPNSGTRKAEQSLFNMYKRQSVKSAATKMFGKRGKY